MKRVAETERDTMAEIPANAGLRPVTAEPQLAVVIAFDVEHVRVAITVGIVWCAIYATARLIAPWAKRLGCILFGNKTPPAHHTKFFLFC